MSSWQSALAELEGAYSDNTLRAYRGDFDAFAAWCGTAGETALPASEDTVARFVSEASRSWSVATIRRRLAGIRKIHRLCRLADPTSSESVQFALRRILRAKGSRQRQAFGLTADLRDALLAACPDTLTGARNRA